MNDKEIRAFKKELLKRRGRQLDILEWGSGGSTVYFTDFLEQEGIVYSWTSIEYNKSWYEKIQEATKHKEGVSLVLFDVGNNNLKQRYIPMDEYVDYPKTLNKKFDVIFVDGRKRRRCVLLAKELLKEDGVVLLHDARRHYYACVRKEYPQSVFIAPEFWRGSLEKAFIFQSLQNSWYGLLFWVGVFPFRSIKNHILSKTLGTKALMSEVSGFRSKLKVMGLVLFFVFKRRGLGFFNFSFSLRRSHGRGVSLFSTKNVQSAPELLKLLRD